ncbi:MAG: RagB/SusD family nutrient uptake outer membrane protein [Bacteroidaceae bacterium]|nr:RagB/SusD family nutrient uptake outer membrane protein [Bacteroidaceae bacterium]
MKTILDKCMLLCLLTCVSCSDFLEREPISFKSEDAYFHTAEDFKLSVNDLYKYLPQNNAIWGGTYTEDCTSDNQCSSSYSAIFLSNGNYRTKAQSNNNLVWNFDRLRAINFAIGKMENALSELDDQVMGSHYLGEAYFFRAWEYFRLLRKYGDLPIITTMMNDDEAALTAQSKRYPRNEVARFIISDLKKAINKLQATAPEAGRISKDAAYALLSRVALYEGTWEKYHAGTCFVPGNSKWPGATTWPSFTFESGSAEAEVNFFLDEAIEAADYVASRRPLDADYQGMFNNYLTVFPEDGEVILARYYMKGVLTHSCSAFLKNGGGCGATRSLVNTFLMANGQPIYSGSSGYKGDNKDTYTEFQNRDPRLTGSVRAAGRYITTTLDATTGKNVNDTAFYNKPFIYNSGNERSTTGYDICKWLVGNYSIGHYTASDPGGEQRTQYNCTTAVPIFRAAECYLNYLEAYYLRHGNLGGNCDRYWKALRQRAGVDTDYSKTIAATQLDKENDLAVWSRGQEVDKTLYNIRRERRCEFIAEGMRLDDLKRWRALDKMQNYQPEGFHLWGTDNEKLYTNPTKELSPDVVSQSGVSVYLRPLQVSASSAAYNGYNFPKPHYLDPVPIAEFQLCISPEGVTETPNGMSILYQNPGWPTDADGPADYTYDCD